MIHRAIYIEDDSGIVGSGPEPYAVNTGILSLSKNWQKNKKQGEQAFLHAGAPVVSLMTFMAQN